MTPAIILPADQWSVLDAGLLWLRAERVEEQRPDFLSGSMMRRERLVPPTIPEGLEPTPCPECDGEWIIACEQTGANPSLVCEHCTQGVVATGFYVGTEQWRWTWVQMQRWQTELPPAEEVAAEHWERRVALLAGARFTGPPIPVVDDYSLPSTMPRVVLYPGGASETLWPDAGGVYAITTDEPWAQGLQVGDVLVPVAVDMLAEPITDEDAGHRDDHWSDGIGPGRVPLSLVPGTWGTVQ